MQRLSYLFLILIAFTAPRVVIGDEAPYQVPFAQQPPTVDGNGTEAVWNAAPVIDNFHMPWLGKSGTQEKKTTRAKILWDREYIYFWAYMEDRDLQSTIRERDGMTWNDDVFEIFLKPSKEHGGYYEFHVTPGNVQMDLFIPARAPQAYELYKDRDSFEFDSAVQLNGSLEQRDDQDVSWELEARIAWKDFVPTGGRPEPNEVWTFALCRYDFDQQATAPTLTTTAPLRRRSFHDYEDFAEIEFSPPVSPARDSVRDYQFDSRKPVTTSRVQGNPEPPLPFTTKNRFPDLRIDLPITVRCEPKAERVWLATQAEAYGPSKVCYFDRNQPQRPTIEVLPVQNGIVHYDLCFHPRYPAEPYLYVGLNGNFDGVMKSRISRYLVAAIPGAEEVTLQDETVIIEWPSNGHNGAAITFGNDGMLYVTSGDGTSDSDTNLRGQDLTELTAKVLRINVDQREVNRPYAVPRDNPFVDREGTRPETWAYGLRNPWRITTDRQSGRIWVGQNGQDLWEQVYLIERGANYGWSVMEGASPFYLNRPQGPDPIQKPIADHHHSEARSLTGGIVYQGSRADLQELKGAYIYGDYSTGKIWGLWHDGNAATKHKELGDTAAAITAFEESVDGEIWILDHLGKSILTLVLNREPDQATSFPRKLSDSGLFVDVKKHQLVEGAIPYSVNAPLWSDGSHKERWFVIPGEASAERRIEFQNDMGWTFPNGTVLVKSFALDLQEEQQAVRRWIETRFMVRQQNEWVGYSYRWNKEGTDAELVERNGLDQEFVVADSSSDNGIRRQIWHYPSRAECMVCHSRAANYTLGLQTAQMNRAHLYDGVEENQLALLERLGYLKVNPQQFAVGSALGRDVGAQRSRAGDSNMLPSSPEKLPRLVNPYDAQADLTQRARAYLHANCSACHQPAGGGNAMIDLRYQVAIENCSLLNEVPRHLTFGIPGAKLIAPGKPEESVLLRRVSTRENGKMPQLATVLVDEEAVTMLAAWIKSLESKISQE